jgi:glycosyltransferase involved in cell wall biosynthesis
MPAISIIVPTHNSETTIEKCLDAIKKSDIDNYELIVVDDASKDKTTAIARTFADEVVVNKSHLGRSRARRVGISAARGEIIVNIDSDIVIKADTLAKVAKHFSKNKSTKAITGLLSKKHPNSNFASQYKNFYMNYYFNKLPEQISFLYGSIYAIRSSVIKPLKLSSTAQVADDTELGQDLVGKGLEITLLKDLEVVHLKKFSLVSLLKNDFRIPFDWAKIFLKYRGWKQLGREGVGFAHASKGQITSLFLAPAVLATGLNSLLETSYLVWFFAFLAAWIMLNLDFHIFLGKEKGVVFGIVAFFMTFADNLIMLAGIITGSFYYVFSVFKPKRYQN